MTINIIENFSVVGADSSSAIANASGSIKDYSEEIQKVSSESDESSKDTSKTTTKSVKDLETDINAKMTTHYTQMDKLNTGVDVSIFGDNTVWNEDHSVNSDVYKQALTNLVNQSCSDILDGGDISGAVTKSPFLPNGLF